MGPIMAADGTTFRQMTWEILEDRYGIQARSEQTLLGDCPPVQPSAALVEILTRVRRKRLPNDRARAYRLIDPVLAELETICRDRITTIPEMPLEVTGAEGLCGNPDFVISASPTFKPLPIVGIFEARKDDIDSGLPQCGAELYAAHLVNGGKPSRLYGCVTTGTDWKLLYFDASGKRVHVDRETYFVAELPRLLGVLRNVIETTLAALGADGGRGRVRGDTTRRGRT
jgi:hypothetical protein